MCLTLHMSCECRKSCTEWEHLIWYQMLLVIFAPPPYPLELHTVLSWSLFIIVFQSIQNAKESYGGSYVDAGSYILMWLERQPCCLSFRLSAVKWMERSHSGGKQQSMKKGIVSPNHLLLTTIDSWLVDECWPYLQRSSIHLKKYQNSLMSSLLSLTSTLPTED